MATISLIDLLGTDNVAVSRTDINKNFQTVENSVNTLETYLNTTPAGGALSIGSSTLTLGANAIGTNLMVNQGSESIAGNLSVGLNLALSGTANITADATVDGAVTLTGSGVTPGFTAGSAAVIPFNLQNVVFMETNLATETQQDAADETTATTGVYQADITNKRKILLDYASFANDATSANVVELTGTPATGQKVWIGIHEVNAALLTEGIYLSLAGFNAKYDALPTITPAQTPAPATVDASVRFFAATNPAYRRQWVEVLYNGANWEVIGSHPSIQGL